MCSWRARTLKTRFSSCCRTLHNLNDMRTGRVWYRLPPIHDGEYLIVFGLGIHDGLLEMMTLANGNARFGTNWNRVAKATLIWRSI